MNRLDWRAAIRRLVAAVLAVLALQIVRWLAIGRRGYPGVEAEAEVAAVALLERLSGERVEFAADLSVVFEVLWNTPFIGRSHTAYYRPPGVFQRFVHLHVFVLGRWIRVGTWRGIAGG
jgi:uncharacterized membrane protein